MKVLIVEPGKFPSITDIRSDLHSMQNVVGGYIEVVYPYDDPVAIVCNEEGKINGLELNRALCDEDGDIYDIIAGTFFVCGFGEDGFISLSEELLKKYELIFHNPEHFVRIGDKIERII